MTNIKMALGNATLRGRNDPSADSERRYVTAGEIQDCSDLADSLVDVERVVTGGEDVHLVRMPPGLQPIHIEHHLADRARVSFSPAMNNTGAWIRSAKLIALRSRVSSGTSLGFTPSKARSCSHGEERMARMKPALGWLALAIVSVACSSGSGRTPGAIRASSPELPMASTVSPTATDSPRVSPTVAVTPPPPDAPIHRDPAALAEILVETTGTLHRSIDAWTEQGDPSKGTAPDDVVLLALYQQRIYRFLARNRAFAGRTLPLLRGQLRAEALANITAARELFSIVRPISRPSRFRTGPPQPAGLLLRWFRDAERRFSVDWELVAAVMFIESKFGRVRSTSTAGAQGPMQFIPSTWAAYGMGGDIHDPHDAIMGAANYLHRSGSPSNDRRALLAYNHSRAYVNAVLSYANQMKRDPRNYFAYYSWQVFVLTTSGDRRITGPGL